MNCRKIASNEHRRLKAACCQFALLDSYELASVMSDQNSVHRNLGRSTGYRETYRRSWMQLVDGRLKSQFVYRFAGGLLLPDTLGVKDTLQQVRRVLSSNLEIQASSNCRCQQDRQPVVIVMVCSWLDDAQRRLLMHHQHPHHPHPRELK